MKGERALSREAWCAWKSVRAGPAARAKALRQEELGPATEVKEGRRGPACEGGAAEQRREQGRAGPRGSPSAARRMRPRRQQQDVAGGSPEEGHRGGGGGGVGRAPWRSEPAPSPRPPAPGVPASSAPRTHRFLSVSPLQVTYPTVCMPWRPCWRLRALVPSGAPCPRTSG